MQFAVCRKLNLPASQGEHENAPDFEMVPASHGWHEEAAVPEKVPDSHASHEVKFEDDTVPALQIEQIVDSGLSA